MSDWRVPGFTSTGSKRPDALFGGGGAEPGEDAGVPERMLRASGCRVWDAQGREYVDYIMALGAVFGALNTMYAAVGSRTKEIGTLLALGFSRGAVLLSFLIESVLLALFGGIIGCLLALPVNGMATSTTNFASFSEIAFRFLVTPPMLLAGMIFAALMGAIGGFFPSRNAAKRVIVEALRQV